jgi:hypothetical protein
METEHALDRLFVRGLDPKCFLQHKMLTPLQYQGQVMQVTLPLNINQKKLRL